MSRQIDDIDYDYDGQPIVITINIHQVVDDIILHDSCMYTLTRFTKVFNYIYLRNFPNSAEVLQVSHMTGG